MGNRAVIAYEDHPNAVGIYVHWNGGRASVEGFLRAARTLHVREGDRSYALARLAQIIGNFFGGTTSIGIGTLAELDCDNSDNGLYIISDSLTINGRKYAPDVEEVDEAKTDAIARDCVAKMRAAEAAVAAPHDSEAEVIPPAPKVAA